MGKHYKWLLLALLSCAFFFHQADRALFGLLTIPIQNDLGLDDVQIGWINTVLSWTLAAMAFVAGPVGDRFSRKWVITVSLMAWSLMTVMMGFVGEWHVLGFAIPAFLVVMFFRSIATGVGESFYGPCYPPLIASYHRETLSVALSVHQGSLYFGLMTSGLIVAKALGALGDWRNVFIAFGSAGFLLGVVFIFALKDPSASGVRPTSPGEHPAGGFTAGYKAFFTNPSAVLAMCGFVAIVFVNNAYLFWAPKFMAVKFGVSVGEAGASTMLWHHLFAFAAILAGAFVTDRMVGRYPRFRLGFQIAALLLGAPCLALVGFSASASALVVMSALYGVFRGCFEVNTHASLFDVMDPRYRSTSVGIFTLFAFFFGGLSGVMMGKLSAAYGVRGFELGFAILGAAYLVGAALMAVSFLFTFRRDRVRPGGAAPGSPAARKALAVLALAALPAAGALAAGPRLEIEEDPATGGLAALRIAGDPARMNWVEGNRIWGEVRRRPCAKPGRVEPYEVLVTRRLDGDTLREEYLVTNTAPYDLFFERGDFGIYATFNDSYSEAGVCETNRCHAHLWCGGEVSWVQAKKMGPYPYELALVLREGALETYSVERFRHENSNDRGDFVLHPPAFRLRPHGTMKLAWDLVAYERGRFDETVRAHGGHVVRFRSFETLFPGETFEIEADGETVLTAPAAPPYGERRFELEVGGKRTLARGFVSPPADELVAARMRRMVAENQVRDAGSPLDGAFVIYDNEERSRFFSYDNRDWNACRERIGMGVTLALWARLHPGTDWAEDALARFERFVLREAYDDSTGEVFDTIGRDRKYRRLYNAPWMITFFLELHAATGDGVWLDRVERTARHYYAGGGWKFYPNGCTFADVLVALKRAGRDAPDLGASVARHVARLVADGIRYPAHEVRFEQTIATPAVTIPLSYHLDVKPDPALLGHVRECLDVLERFDGDQPDHRLGGVPIRHWDDRWFGKRRLLGDTFPHHWAVHSARAYALWARATGSAAHARMAERALRNSLCAFHADGSATCAYVYPFSVTMLAKDGSVESVRRGEFEDPWANDQDLALYFVMKFLKGRGRE